MNDETLDSIRDVKIIQARDGYRFSIDAVLLESFVAGIRTGRGVELGAGSGVISILLAKRLSRIKIVAVEIQEGLANRAGRNVELNKVSERVTVLHEDIKKLRERFETNSFDFAFSNPPFREPGTGRVSGNAEKAVARHEVEVTLPDIVAAASYLLKHSGRLFIIYHPFRLAELISLLREARLEPKRMRLVHPVQGEEATMVLIEAMKGAGTWLKVEPPLYIYDKGEKYTDEVEEMLSGKRERK
jgi:tRNA1Val (adenine37-N6)-methyltransferase